MISQYEIQCGITDNKKWIAGHIPMKSDIILYIDTRTGSGIDGVLRYVMDFIKYQARQMSIPSYGIDDLIQELTAIALAAIPDYSIEKSANMLTFLQNHIKNRMINLYKFATEKCRTATHGQYRFCKTKCPHCENTFIFDDVRGISDSCPFCRKSTLEGKWKKYPVPIAIFSADEEIPLKDGGYTTISECASHDDVVILGSKGEESEDSTVSELSIKSAIDGLDAPMKRIVSLFLEGRTLFEISSEIGMSTSAIKSRIQGLSKNKCLLDALGKEK
jgi:RNA polymerase sigma factor (sigma-70 family)